MLAPYLSFQAYWAILTPMEQKFSPSSASSDRPIAFPGKVHLIVQDHQLEILKAELTSAKAFGFDTETRPSFRKGEYHPVALLQLATETDAYLVRIQAVTQFQIIKSIFEDKNILKTGVAIRDDILQLKKIFDFTPQNFIELQTLAKEKGLQNFGLKGMTEEVMGAKLSKGPKTTNWAAPVLTERQLMYAATDAWIGLRLYQELMARQSLLKK